jgi:hypothetical protein
MQPGREELGVASGLSGPANRCAQARSARAGVDRARRSRAQPRRHCEVAARFGARMGLPAGVAAALAAATRGGTAACARHLARAAIPAGMRLAIVARDAG